MYSRLATLFSTLFLTSAAWADVALLMAEEPGCIYCARWNEEIAPIYPKTMEGKAAPLRRIDITEPLPSDIVLDRRITFTPTFVLLIEGREIQRLEGYPGEDFFWGLLAVMLNEADVAMDGEFSEQVVN